MQTVLGDYKSLKLQLDGIVPPGHGFHRNLLFDTLYASLPRDPQANTAELAAYTAVASLLMNMDEAITKE